VNTARIGWTQSTLQISETRPRQTVRPTQSFEKVLRGGADLLLAGAQTATGLVGGPLLSAAVARVRAGADTTGATSSSAASASAAPSSTDSLKALQEQQISEDLKLLALQSELQRHDRQISLVSNMMKARHDTAKQAIGNIRS